MSQSEQINELSTALSKAQGAMEAAVYNKVNPHFKSKYADLAAVWDAIRKPLSVNGLSITQTMEHVNGADSTLNLVTTLRHSSGQWVSSSYPLPSGVQPQAFGSALTYARRYSLSAIVGIAADEDDDANEAQKAPSRTPLPAGTSLVADIPLKPATKPVDAGEPRELPFADDWAEFGRRIVELAKTPQWPDWRLSNLTMMERMKTEAPKVYAVMSAQLQKARDVHP